MPYGMPFITSGNAMHSPYYGRHGMPCHLLYAEGIILLNRFNEILAVTTSVISGNAGRKPGNEVYLYGMPLACLMEFAGSQPRGQE